MITENSSMPHAGLGHLAEPRVVCAAGVAHLGTPASCNR